MLNQVCAHYKVAFSAWSVFDTRSRGRSCGLGQITLLSKVDRTRRSVLYPSYIYILGHVQPVGNLNIWIVLKERGKKKPNNRRFKLHYHYAYACTGIRTIRARRRYPNPKGVHSKDGYKIGVQMHVASDTIYDLVGRVYAISLEPCRYLCTTLKACVVGKKVIILNEKLLSLNATSERSF